MNKLHLDGLQVESFATTLPAAGARGTVLGYATARCSTLADCPYSYGGTCVITCQNTCDTR